MKKHILTALFLSSLSISAFSLAADGATHTRIDRIDRIAADGTERVGSKHIAADGAERVGSNRIAADGADRVGAARLG